MTQQLSTAKLIGIVILVIVLTVAFIAIFKYDFFSFIKEWPLFKSLFGTGNGEPINSGDAVLLSQKIDNGVFKITNQNGKIVIEAKENIECINSKTNPVQIKFKRFWRDSAYVDFVWDASLDRVLARSKGKDVWRDDKWFDGKTLNQIKLYYPNLDDASLAFLKYILSAKTFLQFKFFISPDSNEYLDKDACIVNLCGDGECFKILEALKNAVTCPKESEREFRTIRVALDNKITKDRTNYISNWGESGLCKTKKVIYDCYFSCSTDSSGKNSCYYSDNKKECVFVEQSSNGEYFGKFCYKENAEKGNIQCYKDCLCTYDFLTGYTIYKQVGGKQNVEIKT
ncbi:hypothetical protein HYW76_01820 [Candidatus Pacearchaeota archaeon]|nr:hypothetical protein [Candidatus Pacearchaeota archaeon]